MSAGASRRLVYFAVRRRDRSGGSGLSAGGNDSAGGGAHMRASGFAVCKNPRCAPVRVKVAPVARDVRSFLRNQDGSGLQFRRSDESRGRSHPKVLFTEGQDVAKAIHW